MLKIVIDANIIVSALITEGFSSKIITDLVLNKKVLLCISEAVFDEYVDVLNRPKFSVYSEFQSRANFVLNAINNVALKFFPDIKIDLISDESDNKFLELAIFAKIDYLITGNTNDFIETCYENIKIVTPREFCENIII